MIDSGKAIRTEDRERTFTKDLLFLALIILFVVFVRVRLLEVPLERDEGEYAYMGQLILQGIPPYSEAYNMKLPGTYLMYALMMSLFGQTVRAIHIGSMIVNCATILLVYLLGKKIVGDFAGIISGATYAILSLSYSVLGFAAHATNFVVLPAIGGALLLLDASGKEKTPLHFFSGVLFGISFIMKQPGIFFFLFGATYIIYRHFSSRSAHLFPKLIALFLGAALPLIIVMLWLYASGVFPRFWFWTVVYAARYGSQVSPSDAFSIFIQNFAFVAGSFFLIWTLSACGLAAIFFHRRLNADRSFVLLLALFSFFSICPGFYFREHYFVTLLPAASLLTGIFIDFLGRGGLSTLPRLMFIKPPWSKLTASAIFIAAALAGIIGQERYLFKDSPARISRTVYGSDPFLESVKIARFIEERSSPSDRVAVFGSEPQIFFYAKRRSATGYLYMYSLMENHDYSSTMQEEFISQVESSKPKFIIEVHVPTSWMRRQESKSRIFDWMSYYVGENYHLIGVADIISPDITVYKWNKDAVNYWVRSRDYVSIFERNAGALY